MPQGLGFNGVMGGEGSNDCFTNLLCHFNGTSGQTMLLDSSRNGIALTAVGTAAISTTQSEFGGSALHVVATGGNYASIASTAALPLGSGPFTVECWVYIDEASLSGNQTILSNLTSTSTTNAWSVYVPALGGIRIATTGGNVVVTGNAVVLVKTWTHIAWVRDASNVNYIFAAGVQQATASNSNNYNLVGTAYIGHDATGGASAIGDITGYLNEVRLSNVARWTANFTAPVRSYTPF